MATIHEVAALAGVSPATVSRVFNGTRVSEPLALKVREAAEELHFTPSRAARNLRMQSSEVIGLVIPDIENPYFTELARGVEDIAQEAGLSVVLCNSDGLLEKEARYLAIAVSENMAGVIIAPARTASNVDELMRRGKPVVAVDRAMKYPIDCVMMDNRAAGEEAANALFAAGYRSVACITGPEDVATAVERATGWRAAVAHHTGKQPPSDHLIYSTFRVDGGRESMRQILDLPNPPDAIVAANNLLGVGALQVLTENGLTPPEFGVSVVGGLPFTTLSPSAVNVVRLPARHMGITAARMLIARIAGDAEPARTVVLRNEFTAAVYETRD